MAVSGAGVRWFFSGDYEACRAVMPFCMNQVNTVRTVMSYGQVEVWTKSFAIPGGGQGMIHAFHNNTNVYITMTGGGNTYIEITDVYAGLNFFYDPQICFNVEGKEIDCTYDNRCFGSARDGSCIVERLFHKLSTTKTSGYVEEEPLYTIDVEGNKTYPRRAIDAKRAIQTMCPPGDASWHHCYRSWSKTVDDYTATAFLFYDHYLETNLWAVTVDKNGEHLPFKAGKLSYPWWPYIGAVDSVQVGGVDPYNVTPVFKAFDLWKETTTEHGVEVVKYYVSILCDPAQSIDVWCLNYSETTMWLETIGISWINKYIEDNHLYFPYVSDGWETRHIRVIGLVKRTGYWAIINCDYGIPRGGFDPHYVYWENDTESGKIYVSGQNDCGFQFAILNEWSETIDCLPAIYCQECEDIAGDVIFDPNYYIYAVNCYTWDCASDVSDCSEMGNVNILSSSVCDVITINGVTYTMTDYSGYCKSFPKCSWYPEYGAPGAVMICDGTIELSDPPILGYHTSNFSFVENIESGEDCDQNGLELGSYVGRWSWGQNYQCSTAVGNPYSSCGTSWRCHCNGACDPCGRCSSGYHGNHINGYCWRINYDHWIQSVAIDHAAVMPGNKIIGHYSGSALEGEKAVCDGVIEADTVRTVDFGNDFPDGDDVSFVQGQWPYYPSYAIVKDAYACTKAIEEERVIKDKFSGNVISDQKFPLKTKETDCHIGLAGKYAYQDNYGNIYSEGNVKIGEGAFFFYQTDSHRRTVKYD